MRNSPLKRIVPFDEANEFRALSRQLACLGTTSKLPGRLYHVTPGRQVRGLVDRLFQCGTVRFLPCPSSLTPVTNSAHRGQHHCSVRLAGSLNLRTPAHISSVFSVANSWLLGHSMSASIMGTLSHAVLCNFSTGPFLTGWLMLVLLACMAFFAGRNRRRENFERFYYTHLLHLPFFALWQLHGVRRSLPSLPLARAVFDFAR